MNRKYITDHTGHTYNSISELCNAWDIPRETFNVRRRQNWPLKDALTQPIQKKKKHENIQDHLGNQFKSTKEMLDYWGIKEGTYYPRISKGWSIEKALTTPCTNNTKGIIITDPFGNVFPSLNKLCEYYKISRTTYHHRTKDWAWSMIEVLGIIPHIPRDFKYEIQILKNFTILRNIKENNAPTDYYEICFNGENTIMHRNSIIELCTEIIRKEKQDANSKKNQDHASCGSSR